MGERIDNMLIDVLKNIISDINIKLKDEPFETEYARTVYNTTQGKFIECNDTFELPETMNYLEEERFFNNYIAYFKNGELYDISPRTPGKTIYEDLQIAYDARYFVCDGIKYDLKNENDIKSIKLPEVDYYLKHFAPAFELTLDELE